MKVQIFNGVFIMFGEPKGKRSFLSRFTVQKAKTAVLRALKSAQYMTQYMAQRGREKGVKKANKMLKFLTDY